MADVYFRESLEVVMVSFNIVDLVSYNYQQNVESLILGVAIMYLSYSLQTIRAIHLSCFCSRL